MAKEKTMKEEAMERAGKIATKIKYERIEV